MTSVSSTLIAALRYKPALMLLAILVLQGIIMIGFHMEETIPPPPNLEQIATRLGKWELLGTDTLDAATEAILKPDDSIVRAYRNSENGRAASLFVGYFKTSQANHPVPHAPIHCLPGAGWQEIYEKQISIPLGNGQTFDANEYVVEKSGQKLVVIYWYQNLQRSWTSHALGKLYTLPDFLRYRRTDVALVRVTILAPDGDYLPLLEPARDLSASVQPALRDRLVANTPALHSELH